jgi:hypothetical protein
MKLIIWIRVNFTTNKVESVTEIELHLYREAIECRGGTLKVDCIANDENTNGFLLAKNPTHSYIYLSALATGNPPISVKWLEECVRLDTKLDLNAFKLSNGYSSFLQQMCSSHFRKGFLGSHCFTGST